jgi:DNA-directed RNA polymerase specialized sigma subunit
MGKISNELSIDSLNVINQEIEYERLCVSNSLKKIERLEKTRAIILERISLIENPTYKRILYLRHVEGKKWEDIAAEMHYATQHIHRIHKKAIAEYRKKE